MVSAVTSALTTVIGWIGTTVTAITSGELAELLPLFAIGIAISAVLLGELYAEGKSDNIGEAYTF